MKRIFFFSRTMIICTSWSLVSVFTYNQTFAATLEHRAQSALLDLSQIRLQDLLSSKEQTEFSRFFTEKRMKDINNYQLKKDSTKNLKETLIQSLNKMRDSVESKISHRGEKFAQKKLVTLQQVLKRLSSQELARAKSDEIQRKIDSGASARSILQTEFLAYNTADAADLIIQMANNAGGMNALIDQLLDLKKSGRSPASTAGDVLALSLCFVLAIFLIGILGFLGWILLFIFSGFILFFLLFYLFMFTSARMWRSETLPNSPSYKESRTAPTQAYA